mmetsp:Transcript_3748/g.8608  ORF Transcript_3748/g.8608 Transcript_3748/m.8608 type:complete len:141 (+) Transcript_3748:556-978(+)
MALRWQLDSYRIERQYMVVGHGSAPFEWREVATKIDYAMITSSRSFASCVTGKPARTRLKAPAHLLSPTPSCPRASRRAIAETCSIFAIRIHTGRRHQIRVHLLHGGHPTLVDGKYTADSVIMSRISPRQKALRHSVFQL